MLFLPGFFEALFASFASTAVSEVGDRSFFTATVLSLRYPRLLTFIATYLALLVQSLTSTTLGSVIQVVVPNRTHLPLIQIATSLLFIAFALSYLFQAISLYRVQRASHAPPLSLPYSISSREDPHLNTNTGSLRDALVPTPMRGTQNRPGLEATPSSVVVSSSDPDGTFNTKSNTWHHRFWKIFCLVYMAEVGDTSMVVTATLAANQNPLAVFCGELLTFSHEIPH
eukprot:Protomagalhaensia_wolfi_Nauph_80__4799@NODE_4_length_7346_cov_85_118106_g2_i0_p4_GENE_NODE_4_length_7346_cov_85_118106_g2_i0NODE_4_length_7346_cov_85_118106_g2_i0_p4_ORF_typecomplete_len227_score10_29UPF0016/PF01169_19/2e12UPF0016/PF01169_19/6_6e08DUF5455/PF17537_2/0_21NrfD/PF03916_14/0_74_NODE_4_length_7346_cov_85_118106_g2_i017082388